METRAVIFDFDGVILDSFKVMPAIYKVIKKELKLEVSDQELESREFFAVNWKDTLIRLGCTTPQVIQQAVEIYHREYTKREQQVEPFKGIKEVLETLAERYKLAIVSSSYEETIHATLKKFHLQKYFQCIVGADQGALKPDPTPVHLCLECLQVTPHETVYIGDMDGDVRVARRAHLKKVIAVTWGYHSTARLQHANPDVIISKPNEILEAVK